MDEIIKTVSALGILWVFVTVIAYVWMQARLKAAIKFEYDEKVKTIDHGYNQQLAKYKDNLERETSEHDIKLTRVFEKQADIIAAVYSKFVAVLQSFELYTGYMREDEDFDRQKQGFDMTLKAFSEYYEPRKLYIEKKTQITIDAFLNKLDHVILDYIVMIHAGSKPIGKQQYETWKATHRFLITDCVIIRDNLEADFKHILGITDRAKS